MDTEKLTAEQILDKHIDAAYKDVPFNIKNDFMRKLNTSQREVILYAMEEYAEQKRRSFKWRFEQEHAIMFFWKHDMQELEKAKQIICELLSKRPNLTPADWVRARYFVGSDFREEWEQQPKALLADSKPIDFLKCPRCNHNTFLFIGAIPGPNGSMWHYECKNMECGLSSTYQMK